MAPTRLGELLIDVVCGCEPRAQAHKVKLQLRREDPMAGQLELQLNPQRLREALGNLIDNAIDVSRDNSQVDIVLGLVASARPQVFVDIVDHGSGVDAAIVSQIFEPFFTTKAVDVGTGIGQAIARRAARDHGGDVVLAATSPQGSVFRLTLPVQPSGPVSLDALD